MSNRHIMGSREVTPETGIPYLAGSIRGGRLSGISVSPDDVIYVSGYLDMGRSTDNHWWETALASEAYGDGSGRLYGI